VAASGDVTFILPAEEADSFSFAPGGVVKKSDLGRFLAVAFERGLTIDLTPAKTGAQFRLKK
jgi:hypothetical protein